MGKYVKLFENFKVNETNETEKVMPLDEFVGYLEKIKENTPFYFYADTTDPKNINLCLIYGITSYLGWIFSSKVGQSEKALQKSGILDKLTAGDFKELNSEEFIKMVKNARKQIKIISAFQSNADRKGGYIIFKLIGN